MAKPTRGRKPALWGLIGSVLCLIAAAFWIGSRSGEEAALIELEDPDGDAGPDIVSVEANSERIGLYEKLELTSKLQAEYDNPYDPEQVDYRAVLRSPSGKDWTIDGFYDGDKWLIRFAPSETGSWRYRLMLTDKTGTTIGEEGSFEAVESDRHGWVQVGKENKRYLQQADGTGFYGVGISYPWGVTELGLDAIKANGGNLITYWNGNYDSFGGSRQLESTASGIGRYDADKGKRVDEIVEMLEARGMKMNFVIWPHDSLADEIASKGWAATWSKNAYSSLGPASEFFSDEEMWKYQEKLYRYIIARWGYSEAIATWGLICEMTGTDGWEYGDREAANAWLARTNDFFQAHDPYDHPTTGSMAGNRSDYWEFGYRTLDIADRENYYDLSIAAYAEDLGTRWAAFEKPLFIGETGNVTDADAYRKALWSTLANGIASTPIWWDYTKADADMFAQMKSFSKFVGQIDWREERHPRKLASGVLKLSMPNRAVWDGQELGDWTQPDWADANKDGSGAAYTARLEEGAVSTSMRFATGSFSQGALVRNFQKEDWSGYQRLLADVYLETRGNEEIKARPVLFPNGEWDEGGEASDAVLPSGQWVTLAIPLHDAPEGYWTNKPITPDDLRAMGGFGVKLWTGTSSADAEPVKVMVRNVRLASDPDWTVEVPESEGWMMQGERTSFGWLSATEGDVAGKRAVLDEAGSEPVSVRWFDTTTGEFTAAEAAKPAEGRLTLTVPSEVRGGDAAFLLLAGD